MSPDKRGSAVMSHTTTPASVPPTASARADGSAAPTTDQGARSRVRNRRMLVNALRLAVLVVFLGGWQLLTATKVLDPFFWGQPSKVAVQLVDWVRHGTPLGPLWTQVWVTMKEALLGFALGVVAGVVCGVALGRVRLLSQVFSPYIKVANSIPRIVLGAVFIVALGLGLPSKVALAFVMVFFAVFFNAFQGTREVDRNLIANARILGASERQVTTHVILPSALTWIIASLHVSFGFAVIGALVGEILGAQAGMGLLISQSQGTFNQDGVFAAMVVIAVVALAAEGLISLLENRLLAWRPPQHQTGAEL
jgi:NitT/TauT family transport system permease protein